MSFRGLNEGRAGVDAFLGSLGGGSVRDGGRRNIFVHDDKCTVFHGAQNTALDVEQGRVAIVEHRGAALESDEGERVVTLERFAKEKKSDFLSLRTRERRLGLDLL